MSVAPRSAQCASRISRMSRSDCGSEMKHAACGLITMCCIVRNPLTGDDMKLISERQIRRIEAMQTASTVVFHCGLVLLVAMALFGVDLLNLIP